MADRADPPTDVVLDWQWRGTATRQANLPPGLRAMHQAVLTAFLNTGAAPTAEHLVELAGWLGLPPAEATARLAAADLVHLDRSGAATVAYPFSGTPTRHRVELPGRPPVWAMCAVDALGLPRMTGQNAQITSTDPHTGDPIRVEVVGATWAWRPTAAVVLLGCTRTADGPRSCCTCPHINFHVDHAHAAAYLADHPELAGQIVDQITAVDIAGRTFGPLLRPSRSTPPTVVN
jgi:hypothetical protein